MTDYAEGPAALDFFNYSVSRTHLLSVIIRKVKPNGGLNGNTGKGYVVNRDFPYLFSVWQVSSITYSLAVDNKINNNGS